jgi:hypothetical protein
VELSRTPFLLYGNDSATVWRGGNRDAIDPHLEIDQGIPLRAESVNCTAWHGADIWYVSFSPSSLMASVPLLSHRGGGSENRPAPIYSLTLNFPGKEFSSIVKGLAISTPQGNLLRQSPEKTCGFI